MLEPKGHNMRFNGMITVVYALLVVIGGMIGFIKANSVPSLIMGMIFALGLLLSAVAMAKGIKLGYYFAMTLAAILACFFAYRYAISYHILPGGVMAVLSLAFMMTLFLRNKPKR